VAVGARRTERLRELEKQIIKDNGEILIQKLDVTTRQSDCDSFVEAVVRKW
jgi:NADP-dependent 3-hydroxy acid dehydrogenase YdfG